MNIKEAKEQIQNAMRAYFTKNKFGDYVIPIEKQRPIFLMGPPGIGKTAIMEQVAQELGVGLVSYSMTHHTRQSALGLPYIETKNYGGKEYQVSEYTMSEILASVYDMMEDSGLKEGILFLDEINCISETLSPAMLQFLQYKIFGRHRVPAGWIVVTAGNPPEYNKSVREFDVVTWDRLKRIDVEPDYTVWKEYAYKKGVHASILSYLDIRKNDFYKMETNVDGKSFVTARGWSDLSDMIKLYEELDIAVNEKLISQYLQNERIVREFAVYYDLFNKYRSDYQVDKILSGTAPQGIVMRAKEAKFDERISLLSLLMESISTDTQELYSDEQGLKMLLEALKNVKLAIVEGKEAAAAITEQQEKLVKQMETGRRVSNMDAEKEYACRFAETELEAMQAYLREKQPENSEEAFKMLKPIFDEKNAELKARAEETGKKMSNLFVFCEKAFQSGAEMSIIVTELTANSHSAHFISRYGCEEYFAHNKELLFYERQREIVTAIENMEL